MKLRNREECRWDLVSLGEVMLRLDPGDLRISTAREFRAWEGGGEYNVARGLRRTFGLKTAVVTALADNPIGRLVESLMLQGGVDLEHVRWVKYDGIGRTVRNGLNFTERGFGVRAALGCSDRGNTAVSHLKPGEIDWGEIFGKQGTRWFHTGGIFCGLSETTPLVAEEAMKAAKKSGVTVSYDLNYRPSLWQAVGGKSKAQQVNRALMPYVDVLFGNEEDFTAALGYEVAGADENLAHLEHADFQVMMKKVKTEFPSVAVVAVTLRIAKSASRNDWGAMALADGAIYEAAARKDLEIYDRVGGGDSFASGLIYGLLEGREIGWAVECGVAHGALAMTTPGDTSMASAQEVFAMMKGQSARISR
ncbi:MAG: sugar kinase [Candidatus Acidiferrum sp.]